MGRSKLAPKAEATYRAVIQLLIEGADINNLTVSEITGRAGIGKGTAYDYFSNKEEMIAGALFYEMENACQDLYEQMMLKENLYDKINIVLVSMEKQMAEIGCFARVIHIMMDNSVIGSKLREMVHNKDADQMLIVDMIRQVIIDEIGDWEEVAEEEKIYLVMTVLSRIVCFAMYQLGGKNTINLESAAMREMICRDVCKSIELYREGLMWERHG